MKRTTKSEAAKASSRLPAPVRPVKTAVRSALAIDPKWWWHYKTLTSLREQLQRDSQEHWSEASAAIEPHSLHPGDSASDEFDHDLALALLAREESALSEVNDAIKRIEQGIYGKCEESGQAIPAQRLRAIPWCRYTREVEADLEAGGLVRRARIGEVVSLQGEQADIPGTGESEPDESEEEKAEAEGPEVAAMSETTLLPPAQAPAPAAAPAGKKGQTKVRRSAARRSRSSKRR